MNIQEIKCWFNAAVPNPTDKNRAVQIGCHFEEGAEMASALGDKETQWEMETHADFYKLHPGLPVANVDRKELLDALADQIVTAVGVAHMFDLDIIGALAEVNRSNWSKFVGGKPVFDENGKIKKGPDYTPPNLDPFVGGTGV